MKKILFALLFIAFVSTTQAQRGHIIGGGYYHGPRTTIGYAPYPYYSFGISPWLYGYPYDYGYSSRPTRLERQIDDIKNDYHDRIVSARHASNLTGKDKRSTIRSLKQERDQKIDDLKANYYKR